MTERADFLVNNRSPRYLHGFQKDTNETTELPHTVPVDNQVTYIDSFTNYGVDTVYGKEYVIAAGSSPTVHNALSGRSDPDAHPASAIANVPAGTIAATTVQAAIDELASEKVQLGSSLTNQRVPFADTSGYLVDSANLFYVPGSGLRISNTTASTNLSTGALIVSGGTAISGVLRLGNSLLSDSTITGSITNPYSEFRLTHHTASSAANNVNALRTSQRISVATGATNSGVVAGGFFETLRNYVSIDESGTLSNLFGIQVTYGHFNTTPGAAPVTNQVVGMRLRRYHNTGSFTDWFDIRVEDSGTGATATNAYGLWIDNVNFGTTSNFAIWTQSGDHSLGGSLRLRTGNMNVSSGVYQVNAVQVLTTQQTGLGASLATRTAGATYGATEQTMLQEAHDKIRLLEVRLKTHGLVAT